MVLRFLDAAIADEKETQSVGGEESKGVGVAQNDLIIGNGSQARRRAGEIQPFKSGARADVTVNSYRHEDREGFAAVRPCDPGLKGK